MTARDSAARPAVLLPALGLLLALAPSCSLTLDFDDECSTAADCAGKGEGVRCVDGLCVIDGGLTVDALLAAPCGKMYGVSPEQYLKNPNQYILLGTLLPATGQLAAYGPPIDNAVRLAVEEINSVGGVLGTKIAVLSCDSGTDPDVAKTSARHMASLGIPAMVGAAASSITIEVFNEVAKAHQMVMVSPASTAPSITDIVDDGLLWRTAPSDAVQGNAISRYLVEGKFEKVAVIHRDDAYGIGFLNAINDTLCGQFDCKDGLFVRKYVTDPEDAMKAAQAEAISQLGAFGPQVIVLIGFVDDGIAFMKAAADKGMKTFVLTDGLKSDEVLNQLSADHEDVLCEVVGTNPANPEGKAYAIFEISFKSKYGEPPGAFTAHAYDALYALAYAAAAANKKPGTLTGMDFAAGLMRLTGGGTVIPVGTGKWTEGAALLHNDSGVAIDFEGASGKLEFDNDKGEPKTTAIEGWFFDTEKKQVQSLGVILTDGGEYKTPAGLPVCGGAESPL